MTKRDDKFLEDLTNVRKALYEALKQHSLQLEEAYFLMVPIMGEFIYQIFESQKIHSEEDRKQFFHNHIEHVKIEVERLLRHIQTISKEKKENE